MARVSMYPTLVVRLETLSPPELGLLKDLSDCIEKVLEELSARAKPSKPIALWTVRRVDIGSLSIEVEGKPASEQVNVETVKTLCHQLVEDIHFITRDPLAWIERNPGRDSQFLLALRQLGNLAVKNKANLTVEYGGWSVVAGGALVEKLNSLLQVRYQDWGSVEGTLEMITIHQSRYCRLYPMGVKCHFPQDLLPRVKELIGKRVLAWGKLFRSRTGAIEKMELKHLEPIEAKPLEEIRPENPMWPGKTYEELHRITWRE